MRRTILFGIGVVMCASAVWAQPAIRADNGVLNASSYAADIARGSWFVVFGSGMGPATLAVYSGALPYPTELSGTKVNFTPAAGGTAVDARLWYTSAGQLAGLLPSATPAGDYDVRVTYNAVASVAKRVKVVERNFGYATQAQNGSGPAQATYGGLDLNRFATGTLPPWSTRPAKGGDTMVLWGTGLGADPSSDLDGRSSGDQTAAGQVRVIVGGIEVTPAYAGRSGGSPGLDQINFTVPANAAPSCFVSLQVRAGGRLSNLGSIAVAEAGKSTCTHPTLSQGQLIYLDEGGSLVVGLLSLNKLSTKLTVPGLGSFDRKSEDVSGGIGRYTVDTVSTANFSLAQAGACFVIRRAGSTDDLILGVVPSPLDAGAQLTLNGPNLTNKAVPRRTDKTYSLSLYNSGLGGFGGTGTPTLSQGAYTLTGPGGADVGAFSARVDFPGEFVWTNQDAIADPVSRAAALPITWTGGGAGLVTVVGAALQQAGGTTQDPIYAATIFTCVTQASAGSFTVPAAVLQQLPAVANDPLNGSSGILSVVAIRDVSNGQGTFTAPLTAGGAIDAGFLVYSNGSSKTIGWQ